ncbi:MAG: hypothetical protein JST68_18955 [Bacteroidetes bacterium]|nr:hypothetical protein [Bacteroidota bacterium]
MKYCFFLLVVGAAPFLVRAQTVRKIEFQKLMLSDRDSVRILTPDRMACLLPDLRRVEAMPVRRMWNADPMVKKIGGK